MGRVPCHESGYSPDLELGSMNISDLGCLIISMQVQEHFCWLSPFCCCLDHHDIGENCKTCFMIRAKNMCHVFTEE